VAAPYALAQSLPAVENSALLSKKLKNIGVVAGFTVVSRVLGLVRDQLSAAVFGADILNSAFVTAFRLPNLFRRLLGEGSLTAAFIPTLQQELTVKGREGAFRLVNQVLCWLALVTGVLVGLGMLLCTQSRLLPGHAERWYLGADLTVILFPYLLFVCLAAVLSGTLNVLQSFSEGAISPVLLNVSMILSLGGAGLHWASSPMGQMYWLCAGVLIGGFLQFALPAWSLMREGWRPRIDFSLSPGVREIALLMLPGLWGAAIYQINQFVIQLLVMTVDDSAPALLFYAGRLMELPIGVFAIAISTVVYPLIARHAAERNFAGMADDYLRGIRLILIVNIPAAVGLGLLSEPIVRVLFQHGHFTAAQTTAMAPLLAISVLGLPFYSVVSLTTRAFYAMKDTATPVRVATVNFVVNLIGAVLLMTWLGTAGLVLAGTIAVIVQCLMLQRRLVQRIPGMHFGVLARDLGKIFAAAALMGLAVAAGWWLLLRGHGFRGDLVALLVLVPLGCVIYGVMLWLLRIGGREEFEALWAKLRAKVGL